MRCWDGTGIWSYYFRDSGGQGGACARSLSFRRLQKILLIWNRRRVRFKNESGGRISSRGITPDSLSDKGHTVGLGAIHCDNDKSAGRVLRHGGCNGGLEADQFAIWATIPLKVTLLPPCVAPKPVPLITTRSPTDPRLGDNDEIERLMGVA